MASKAVGIAVLFIVLGFGVTYFNMTNQINLNDYRFVLVFLVLGVLGVLILHYKWKRR